MKNVPTMISTKDLSYLEDMFNWNICAYKKFNDYLGYVEDKNISTLLEELIDMHIKNCNEIVNILESEDK